MRIVSGQASNHNAPIDGMAVVPLEQQLAPGSKQQSGSTK